MDHEPISFMALQRDHLPRLATWLAEPLVARWWAHDPSPEAVEEWFGPSVDGEDSTELFLAVLSDRPVGMIQRYRIDAYAEYVAELTTVCRVPEAALSIDYMLGEPDVRGRGLGARMICAFVGQSWSAYPESRDVIVPVAAGNPASWKSLERAGFARIAKGELKPDNPIDPPDHFIYGLARPDRPDRPEADLD